jgi:flagellar basal body-associated protein FliL
MAANKTNGRVKVVLTLFILVLLGGILGLIAWQVEDSKSSNGKTHVPVCDFVRIKSIQRGLNEV